MSYTFTNTSTFTRTSAQYIASKVAADLRRMNAFYGHSEHPSEQEVEDYYNELVEFLIHGFLESVEYGFKRNKERIVSLKYSVQINGTLTDSHAGGVYARADINGASWFSFLCLNSKISLLSPEALKDFHGKLPFVRSEGQAPKDGQGYWAIDRSYFTDGVGTQRQTFRPY